MGVEALFSKMETKTTLKALFESRRDELSQKLANLSLPKDAALVQQIVSNYLNDLFDSEGDYRQNLTQSEDYILQAAMSLLNAQQSMASEFAKNNTIRITDGQHQEEQLNAKFKTLSETAMLKPQEYPYVIGGSAVGGVAGALLLGSWGAVFGAIAGTALVLYYSTITGQPQRKAVSALKPIQINSGSSLSKETDVNLDTGIFLGIVGNICDSVDSLIQTFRAQINRVVDKYANVEKPRLEKEYSFLLEGIQTLIGYKRTHTNDDKYLSKLQMRIEDLAEALENYNLSVEEYVEEHSGWFETVESTKVETPQMVYPAIVKEGQAVLSGKVFIPVKQE